MTFVKWYTSIIDKIYIPCVHVYLYILCIIELVKQAQNGISEEWYSFPMLQIGFQPKNEGKHSN